MFSTRPITPLVRRRALSLPTRGALLRRVDALPHSPNHSAVTSRSLYVVGLSHAATAVVYVGLVISSFTGAFIPVDSNVLFVVPTLMAFLGIAMVAIGLLGSLSAPWMAALLSLPLAFTALYVDSTAASCLLAAMLLVPATWLTRNLMVDAGRRSVDD